MTLALIFGGIGLTGFMLWLVWGPRFKPDRSEMVSYAKRTDSATAFDPELQFDGDTEKWLREKR